MRGYFHSLTCLNGCAEFRVYLAGRDLVIGMRVYSRGKAKKYLLLESLFSGNFVYRVHLFDIVAHKVADAVVHGVRDIPIRLVISLEIGVFHREARLERGVDLSGGDHVRTKTLLRDYPVYSDKARSLAGVKRAGIIAEELLKGV